MTEVNKAAQTIAKLEDARKELLQRNIELTEAMYRVSFDVHTGDKKARDRLDKLKAEHRDLSSELISMEAAIAEANKRLAAAEHAAVSAADCEKAKQIAALNSQLKEELTNADDAFADAIGSVLAAKELFLQLHALGIASPTDQLYRINAVTAIKTAIQKLPEPWIRDFEFSRLAPLQKKTFRNLANAWCDQVAIQIAAKFGAAKDKAA
jgi:chromosome segregation ATPase